MNASKDIEVKYSSKAKDILARLNSDTKQDEIRNFAKEVKKDHELAMELWSTGEFKSRLLAIIIMDKKISFPRRAE